MRLTLVVTLAVLALGADRAVAYPRFQLTTGAATCGECHLSPAGGGLLTDYGRLEAGDTVSRGGDGALLHGLWTPPSWLALGGDFRFAGLVKADDGDRETAAFPMQADVHVRAGGAGVTFNLTVGLRGVAREPRPRLIERLASREHYVMYERAGYYARVGRFFPVFGLRTQDHTAFIRRDLGFGLLEEPYGIAAGVVRGEWEAHLHGFKPRPVSILGAGPLASGVAFSYERRILELAGAIGVQARYASTAVDARTAIGVTGKRWFERAGLLLHGEIDVQHQTFTDGPGRWQLASYLGAAQQVRQGVWVGVGLHRWQPDLGLRSSRDAADLDVQYFPRAHLEVHLLLRASAVGNDLDTPGFLSLLQLHYYL